MAELRLRHLERFSSFAQPSGGPKDSGVNIVHFMYVNFITITSVLDGSCSIATCLDADTGLQSSSRLIEAARDRESRGKVDCSTAVIRPFVPIGVRPRRKRALDRS
jgi:hypothetical protein